MERSEDAGLMPDALDKLTKRIDPASIANTAVNGIFWPVYLRPHLASSEQACLGVVIKVIHPPVGLMWKLANPELARDFYSDETLEQWRWMIEEVKDALTAGEETSPIPNSIIYGQPQSWQGRTPQRALQVLFDSVTGLNRGLLAKKNHGGIADNPTQTTSEVLRGVVSQLDLAAEVIDQYGRATIYRIDHHLVTALDLGPAESCDRHAKDILTAAVKMTAQRHDDEPMAICAMCDSAEREAADLIARLKEQNVEMIANTDPKKLRKQIERMLAGGQRQLDL